MIYLAFLVKALLRHNSQIIKFTLLKDTVQWFLVYSQLQKPSPLFDFHHLQKETFIEITGYKIDIQKSVVFLYTSNEQSKHGIKKTIPFSIVSKIIKY